jgi:hypothetical protein
LLFENIGIRATTAGNQQDT